MHGSDVLFNGTCRSRNLHRHGRIPNARRNGVELVFAIFRCNFSFALQRAKERTNPSSYAEIKAVRVNATQNGILGPRTRLELTCTSSYDWTFKGIGSAPL